MITPCIFSELLRTSAHPLFCIGVAYYACRLRHTINLDWKADCGPANAATTVNLKIIEEDTWFDDVVVNRVLTIPRWVPHVDIVHHPAPSFPSHSMHPFRRLLSLRPSR